MKKLILPDKKCKQCGDSFNRSRTGNGRLECHDGYKIRIFCSRKCYWDWNQGKNHANFKDGIRRGHGNGYLRRSDGTYIHREVMEKKIGRPLKFYEHVHHIDGNPENNLPANLELTTNSEHRKQHVKSQTRDKNGKFKCRKEL